VCTAPVLGLPLCRGAKTTRQERVLEHEQGGHECQPSEGSECGAGIEEEGWEKIREGQRRRVGDGKSAVVGGGQ
jgi:hypothetical protein